MYHIWFLRSSWSSISASLLEITASTSESLDTRNFTFVRPGLWISVEIQKFYFFGSKSLTGIDAWKLVGLFLLLGSQFFGSLWIFLNVLVFGFRKFFSFLFNSIRIYTKKTKNGEEMNAYEDVK
ncbi:hypothetical protein RhiirA4_422630 [Rhizophagus irregularis]|uniref:Uncharacterized protein n=1 Tax=Rhizophagus irregularis TaxID=588596 RepID=A0A2I1GR66_9GLOM|nr:hypothetical protein RhiirA4_422630 [Rhizophagus irregularis]